VVEARVDDDGRHDSWFPVAVLDFEPARCCRSPARYTTQSAHLRADIEGVLTEPFTTSVAAPSSTS
jgi:hypothetical protein